MELTIKYFGAVAEAAGLTEEALSFEGNSTDLAELKAFCENKYQGMSALSYQVSVNKKLLSGGPVNDGDEIAFLPPFAGG